MLIFGPKWSISQSQSFQLKMAKKVLESSPSCPEPIVRVLPQFFSKIKIFFLVKNGITAMFGCEILHFDYAIFQEGFLMVFPGHFSDIFLLSIICSRMICCNFAFFRLCYFSDNFSEILLLSIMVFSKKLFWSLNSFHCDIFQKTFLKVFFFP